MLIDGVSSGSTVTCAVNDQVLVKSVSTTQFKLSRIKYDGTAQVGGSSVVRSARTSNTILAAGDNGTLIDITSGTFSQTFTAAATLGSGWFCYIRNAGTGDITLDPNSTETIDALATYVMYGGETRLVQCDGSGFNSVVLSSFYRAFTSTGTFTKPPGYSLFKVIAIGAGGGGEKDSFSGRAKGGGGGGAFEYLLPASFISATETVTIGAGGVARTTDLAPSTGGNTTFGTNLIGVSGGQAHIGGSVMLRSPTAGTLDAIYSGVAVNTISGGFTPSNAGNGSDLQLSALWGGGSAQSSAQTDSGGSVYGGAAGGSLDATTIYKPGKSIFSGNGGPAVKTSSGTAGDIPGGGGGASYTGAASGAGARGELRIWGIA